MGHIEKNPLAGFEKPSGGKRETVITPAVFQTILEYVKDDAFRELLTVVWETGCRPQEILILESRDVDLAQSRWIFPRDESKCKKQQRVVYTGVESHQIIQRLCIRYPIGKLFRNSPRQAVAEERRQLSVRSATGRVRNEVLLVRLPALVRDSNGRVWVGCACRGGVDRSRRSDDPRPNLCTFDAKRRLSSRATTSWCQLTIRIEGASTEDV